MYLINHLGAINPQLLLTSLKKISINKRFLYLKYNMQQPYFHLTCQKLAMMFVQNRNLSFHVLYHNKTFAPKLSN